MNRIAMMVTDIEATLKDRLAKGLTTPEKVAELSKELNLTPGDLAKLQELKSLAVADQTFTLEEGQTIYSYLTWTVNAFNRQPLSVKLAMQKVYAILIAQQVRAAQIDKGNHTLLTKTPCNEPTGAACKV